MPHAISRVGGLVAEQGAEGLGEAYQRASRPSDLRYLADNMRANDVAEVMACSGCTPDQMLLYCALHSVPCRTMVSRHGHVMGMWGVIPEASGGRVWMLGTEGMVDDKRDRRTFLRKSKEQLQQLFSDYSVLFNVVDARNTVHIRWIKHMGFTFVAEHAEWGPEKRLFYEFVRI